MNDDTNFAAYVGIDWADKEHAVALATPDGRVEPSTVAQTPTAIDEWACRLRDRFGGRPIAVCLEQSRGALVYALIKYPWLILFPINPKQLARYREAVAPSGAKDDPGDAQLLCDFVRLHRGRLRAWRAEDVTTRSIRELVEARRKFVALRTSLGNQLRQTLKECFPQALELAGAQMHAQGFLKLLARCPSFKDLQRASARTLATLLPRRRKASADDAPRTDPRLEIRRSPPLVTDPALLLASKLAVQTLVAQLMPLNRAIAQYDRELAALMAQHPDAELFEAFPGAGTVLAPRLLAAFGRDRQRYATADEMQQASGIAPVKVQSGKSCKIHRRRGCSKFLRQTFHEFADHSRKASTWASAYYHMLRAKGHRHHAAVRSLAFKWIRVLFRCWQTRTSYDETLYLARLRHKKSTLLAYIPNN